LYRIFNRKALWRKEELLAHRLCVLRETWKQFG
jgi:hypothetical protein